MKYGFPVSVRLVHLVDKQNGRYVIAREKTPQRAGMSLYPIACADNKNCHIQNLKRALHLRRKIHMAGRIKQRKPHILEQNPGLLGKNRDAALPLLTVCVQKSVFLIHPARFSDAAAQIKQRFR